MCVNCNSTRIDCSQDGKEPPFYRVPYVPIGGAGYGLRQEQEQGYIVQFPAETVVAICCT